MARSGGAVSTGAATRLVYLIGVIKWVVLALLALWVVAMSAGTAGADSMLGAFAVLFLLYGLVAGLCIFAFLGWLQQTLLMLVGIAKNTAPESKRDLLSRL